MDDMQKQQDSLWDSTLDSLEGEACLLNMIEQACEDFERGEFTLLA